MLLIHSGKLITRDSKNPFIADGAVAIDGNLIAAVGESAVLKASFPDAEQMDAKGRLIMPGFINTHMHYYSTFARGMQTDSKPAMNFLDILEGLWWRLDKKLTLDDVFYSAVAPMIEQIRCGVTSVIDHHAGPCSVTGSLFKLAEAASLVGIRSNLCYEVSDRDGEAIADAGIKENADFIRYCQEKKSDMIKGLMGMHAQMTISEKTMAKVTETAEGLNAGYHVHAAEAAEDLADAKEKYGCGVVQRLHKAGVLSEKSIVVHAIHISDEEIGLLKESGVAVVHNPESNMGNAVGTSPVLKMMEAGVLLGLGTDAYTADMTESLKAANVLHKHAAGVPSVGWAEPPAMLFENNRTIMNRFIEGQVGILQAGACADVILVDYDPPTPLNANTIDSHILFGVTGRHVDTTIVNGKLRMKDRQLVDIDGEALLAKSREQAEALWKRI
jgi:putative selenium metabolism protein SsnA